MYVEIGRLLGGRQKKRLKDRQRDRSREESSSRSSTQTLETALYPSRC